MIFYFKFFFTLILHSTLTLTCDAHVVGGKDISVLPSFYGSLDSSRILRSEASNLLAEGHSNRKVIAFAGWYKAENREKR